MKWLKQFIGSRQAKEPKIHYKVGVFYAEVFDRAEAYSSR
jgi:hypothetical protein